MPTLICAGGSGSRVMEAVLHLCAAGLGPDTLRILMIDPDAANGNGTRVKHLLDSYVRCRSLFGGKMGGMPFFGTEVDLVQTDGQAQGLNVWNPVASDKTFGDILNHSLLPALEKDVASLFFTQDELGTNLEKGFRGHPAIGAAAMSLLPLYLKKKPWDLVAEKIRSELDSGDSRVVIAGSVFGGTGAAAIHPLARFLRGIPEMGKEKLKIGVVALVPYFRFAAAGAAGALRAGELTAKADRFSLATRAAVEFYGHLRENKDWDFGAMYWLGDDSQMEVPYSVGGEHQENPAHIVDLLAGFACLDFFQSPQTTGACHYAGPRATEVPAAAQGKNVVYWEDVPVSDPVRRNARARITQFLIMGAMHAGFFKAMFDHPALDKRPFCVPWYLDRFAGKGDCLTKPEALQDLADFDGFFLRRHLPWWKQILSVEPERVRLLNRGALQLENAVEPVDLTKLGHLDFPSDFNVRPVGSRDFVDSFFGDMVEVSKSAPGQRGASCYVSLLAFAAERFYKREYLKND